jgi:hypothetical protein
MKNSSPLEKKCTVSSAEDAEKNSGDEFRLSNSGLAGLTDADRIVRKTYSGRGLEFVREIPDRRKEPFMRTHALFPLLGLVIIAAGNAYPQQPTSTAPAGTAVAKPNASQVSKTIVSPHLEARIDPNTNVLWCSTFQLAWNEMCLLAGGPLQIKDAPPMVGILNKRTATRDDIDEASYLAMAGIGPAAIEKINKELDRKFPGKPDLRVPDAAKDVGEKWWIAFACLLKDMLFEEPFDHTPQPMRFLDAYVNGFGVTPYVGEGPEPNEPAKIREEREKKQRQRRAKLNAQVLIHDYKDSNDFVIELKTKSKDDRLILAKVQPKDTLAGTIDMVFERVGSSKPTKMADEDQLDVPVIHVDITKHYKELIEKEIVQAHGPIMEALQTIRFGLDEKGAQLMSLAYLNALSITPHYMEFDKPFLILLQRKDAKNPYFALWVGNPEFMAKVEVKVQEKVRPKKPSPFD